MLLFSAETPPPPLHNTKRNPKGQASLLCHTIWGRKGGLLGGPWGGGGGVTYHGNTTQHYITPNLVVGGGGRQCNQSMN